MIRACSRQISPVGVAMVCWLLQCGTVLVMVAGLAVAAPRLPEQGGGTNSLVSASLGSLQSDKLSD